MPKYTIDLTDAEDAGVSAARQANADPMPTNADYVQFVMQKAAQSYANRFQTEEGKLAAKDAIIAQKDAAIADLTAQLATKDASAQSAFEES
jgi:hypothetical protein